MTNEERNIEALHIHIEGLQATLTKRNQRIAELEAKLNNPDLINNVAVKKSYKKGWQDAAHAMMSLSMDAAKGLRKVREDAWKVYLEGERK
jgi:hypothetical protein